MLQYLSSYGVAIDMLMQPITGRRYTIRWPQVHYLLVLKSYMESMPYDPVPSSGGAGAAHARGGVRRRRRRRRRR